MDRSNYKRLGDYIRSVDVRNRDLAVTNLLGVSISKTFIPSIANTIGTDMSTYKVVEPYQFAYSPVTSRNGDKITFALYKGTEKCIISQAYETFEIVDKEQLDPDYLMMWALRPEFDRYARFKSNGSAREIFSWDEMCEAYLPVPDIATQRRIVAEFQTVETRISGLCAMLSNEEETMKAIFLSHFERKSDQTILQQSWRFAELGEFCDFFTGKKDVNQSLQEGKFRFFSCSSGNYYSNEAISNGPAVIIAGNGYTGRTTFSAEPFDLYQRAYACMLKPSVKHDLIYFIYAVAKFLFEPSCQDEARGTTIQYIVKGDLEHFTFTYEESVAIFCNKVIKVLLSHTLLIQNEIECMGKLKSLLLSKLA